MIELDLDRMFSPYVLTGAQATSYGHLAEAAKQFAAAVVERTPPCEDQGVALRKIREALMTAQAALALDGRQHRRRCPR